MNLRRKKRLWIGVGILLSTSAITGLILYALNTNMDLFYTPSEVLYGKSGQATLKPMIGQRMRVGGMVTVGSVQRDPQTLDVKFALHDGTGEDIYVVYQGLLPDLFREGQGIVAQGVLENGNTVRAHEVLAKHDETYVPPEIMEAMKKKQK